MNQIDLSHMAVKAPPTPSKYNIIPIHTSDRGSFKFCRRQWAWSSPSKLNLVPRTSVYGVQKNLWFGNGIHHALERFYNPILHEDPAVAWESWFDLQWNGGVVYESEVKQFADREPQPIVEHKTIKEGDPLRGTPEFVEVSATQWKVSGLCDILPDTVRNEELFMEMRDLGSGMMKFYKDYAEANDNFRVILVEHDFSVPVLNAKGEPLYMVDNRIMPDDWEPDLEKGNEFGPYIREANVTDWHNRSGLYIEKQVHVRGRQDLIIQEQEYGRYGIMDHKTASVIGEDYFRHLELDEQCTSYLSFGELEARIHGLEYKQLEFITYQALLKGYPKPPTFTTKGLPSLDRTKETTTAPMFEAAIKDNGLELIFKHDEKMQRYYTWLLEKGDKRFIQRTDTWRNHMQRKNAMIRVYYESIDMLSNPVAYPNPTKNYACLNCAFRGPCIQAESGDDYMQTLEDGYIPNWDR